MLDGAQRHGAAGLHAVRLGAASAQARPGGRPRRNPRGRPCRRVCAPSTCAATGPAQRPSSRPGRARRRRRPACPGRPAGPRASSTRAERNRNASTTWPMASSSSLGARHRPLPTAAPPAQAPGPSRPVAAFGSERIRQLRRAGVVRPVAVAEMRERGQEVPRVAPLRREPCEGRPQRLGAPLIAFLDSDDLWAPSKLERQLAFMRENPGCAISQTSEIWIRNGRRVNPGMRHRKRAGDFFVESLSTCLVSPSAVLMEKQLFRFSRRIRRGYGRRRGLRPVAADSRRS